MIFCDEKDIPTCFFRMQLFITGIAIASVIALAIYLMHRFYKQHLSSQQEMCGDSEFPPSVTPMTIPEEIERNNYKLINYNPICNFL